MPKKKTDKLAKKKLGKRPKTDLKKQELEVVGIGYRVTPSTQRRLAQLADENPIKCTLEREPKNTHDKNAVKVILASTPYKGMHVGYLSRGVAEVISPAIKLGVMEVSDARLVEVNDGSGTLELDYFVNDPK